MPRRRRRSLDDTATLNALVGNLREGVYITDQQGHFLDCNPAFLAMLGVQSREELARYRTYDLMVEPGLRDRELELLARNGAVHEFEFQIRRPDGQVRTVLDACTAVRDPNARGTTYHGILIDITERIRAQEALRVSEERYALAVHGANDGIWDWDITDDRMYFSPRWKAMLGYQDEEMRNHSDEWFSRVHPDDLKLMRWGLQAHLTGESPLFEHEYRMRHQDGSWRWMLCRGVAVRGPEGHATRMAGSLTDITERKLTERQLLHDAFHDALTQLPNRGLFADLLSRAVGRLRRHDEYLFGVLFLDLDRFKLVNDSLGHTVGDELLVAVARRLERCVRPGDTVARLGGDEFAMLLDGLKSASHATRVAERIHRELARPFTIGEREVFTTASIGIALSSSGYEKAEHLLRDADLAMYRAKSLGKARYDMFDREMHALSMAQLELENDLRRALDRGEFRVYYQPIVSLSTGRPVGFEALTRWEHPTRGLIGPAAFIPAAEETGLIIPLGQWVLGEACRTLRAFGQQHPTDPPLTVSVNLSPRQFRQPDLVERVRGALEASGLPAARLRLEITESTVMEHVEPAMAMLAQLRTLGVKLHLDDFGTGYSSLSYLPRFQIDALKIDQSFVSGIGPHGENAEIVGVIVTLARNLGIEVIAEGVETAEQLAVLRALRCGQVQGFYFSRPLAPEEVPALLATLVAS